MPEGNATSAQRTHLEGDAGEKKTGALSDFLRAFFFCLSLSLFFCWLSAAFLFHNFCVSRIRHSDARSRNGAARQQRWTEPCLWDLSRWYSSSISTHSET
nr:hypothetical protein [Pandoravirus belohorizontensis]